MAQHPGLIVEVAFRSRPTDPPIWEDITPWVKAVDIRRGRNNELDQIVAGTARVIVDNRDGRFTPANPSSPYAPDVKPMRRLRVRATWGSQTYDLFGGFVERWPLQLAAGRMAEASLEAVDGLAILAAAKVTASWPSQPTGQRISAVLSAAGWTQGQRVDNGLSWMPAASVSGVDALSHARAAELVEMGWLFVAGDGAVVFHDRARRIHPTNLTPVLTIGSAPGELPASEVVIDTDTPIWTRVEWQRQGGALQAVEDLAATAEYLLRVDRRDGLPFVDDVETRTRATVHLQTYSSPRIRLAAAEVAPDANPAQLWPLVLPRDLSDVVLAKVAVPAAPALEQLSFIEGIEWSIEAGRWVVRWALSPADTLRYWVLDVAGFSELGTATRLGW